MSKVYRAAPGARFSHKRAQIYGDELDHLEAVLRHPPSTDEILKAARNPSSPLHNYFQWNTRKAALQFWRVQARELVNHIQEFLVERKGDETIRARFNVETRSGKSAYVSRDAIERDPYLRDQVITYAQREAENWSEKYRRYREFLLVHRAIRVTGRKVQKKKRAGRQPAGSSV